MYRALLACDAVSAHVPYLFSCLRVFTINPSNTAADTAFYRDVESESCAVASTILVLSEGDKRALQDVCTTASAPASTAATTHKQLKADALVIVLHPPLRRDIALLATNSLPPSKPTSTAVTLSATQLSSSTASVSFSTPSPASASTPPAPAPARVYVTCCCRLSPEKNVGLFVDLMIALKPVLLELQLVPFLCGVGPESATLKQRLQTAFASSTADSKAADSGGCVIRDFMNAAELASVLQQSVLNVHPCLYEAYGMTIVEAAALGTPSLLHHKDIGGFASLGVAHHV